MYAYWTGEEQAAKFLQQHQGQQVLAPFAPLFDLLPSAFALQEASIDRLGHLSVTVLQRLRFVFGT
jgi:hypothetical protein